jgi:hypothetical protein
VSPRDRRTVHDFAYKAAIGFALAMTVWTLLTFPSWWLR